jgi:hypothetical protein
VSVEASCVDSLYISNIVKISGESQECSPNHHLELLLPCTYGRKIWQFATVETQLLDDAVHLVKHIEEPPIGEVEVLTETVDCDDYPVSVATVALLDCWIGIA